MLHKNPKLNQTPGYPLMHPDIFNLLNKKDYPNICEDIRNHKQQPTTDQDVEYLLSILEDLVLHKVNVSSSDYNNINNFKYNITTNPYTRYQQALYIISNLLNTAPYFDL